MRGSGRMRCIVFSAVAIMLCGTTLAEPEPVGVGDLESMLVDHQFEYLIIAPPTWNEFVQPYGNVLPVDVKALPQSLRKGMDSAKSYGDATLYRFVAIEELTTRDTVFLALDGTEILRLKAPEDYDPYAWQKDLFGEEEWADASEWDRWFFDTARVGALFSLVDASEYDIYLLAENQARQDQLLSAQAELDTVMMAMSSMGTVTNLQVSIGTTNGMAEVTVAWPDDFADTLEFYAIDDLLDWPWSLVKTNISTASGTQFAWIDTDSTNYTARFYVAGNADADGDGDGDGFGNLEEEKRGTNPASADANSVTGTVATIRYYYDSDDRLTDFFTGTSAAERDTPTSAHNLNESVVAGGAQ